MVLIFRSDLDPPKDDADQKKLWQDATSTSNENMCFSSKGPVLSTVHTCKYYNPHPIVKIIKSIIWISQPCLSYNGFYAWESPSKRARDRGTWWSETSFSPEPHWWWEWSPHCASVDPIPAAIQRIVGGYASKPWWHQRVLIGSLFHCSIWVGF